MGAYTEIVDFTFTANETSRTFSGLSITKDDFIKVVITHKCPPGTNSDIRCLANNSINTNYHIQELSAFDSGTGGFRANLNRIIRTGSSNDNLSISYLKLSENDRFNIFSNDSFVFSSSIANVFRYTTSSGATFTSGITSLTFTSSVTNSIGTGSRIQIYKLDAEKVADITVTSNTTQVDISNLSIDKDSEYLLVYECLPLNNGIDLFINDNTTVTNYHQQTIFGSGSSVGAVRGNNARIEDSTGFIGYAHIKLSNIGAYTFQAYNLRAFGTTTPLILHRFGSSTAENITSITKLNLKANDTNGILSGSRFILYKLYE